MEKWIAEIVEVAFVFSQMATLPEDLPVLYNDISMLVGDPIYLNDWLVFFRYVTHDIQI